MPHYFIDPSMRDGDRVALSGPLGRHLAGALRVRCGERLELVLDGIRLTVCVTAVERGSLSARVEAETPLPEEPFELTLWVGLPKGRKLEEIVRHATELGACRVVPVVTRRSVPRERPTPARAERLAAIALEAAQQSRRARIPEVAEPVALAAALAAPPAGRRVVLWERERECSLAAALTGAGREQTLLVGPEGGLDPDEVETLRAAGFVCASLGPFTLRAETACLAALAVAAHAACGHPQALTGTREGL